MSQRPQSTGERFRADVVRIGLVAQPLRDLYHFLLDTTWTRLFAIIGALYLTINALFGGLYLVVGDGIENARAGSFEDAFFFSVQTMATIGYGKMVPRTTIANALVTTEALIGMLGVSLGTGLMFAKFSRPRARVLWSRVAVIGPRDGTSCLMFRIANERSNQIVEASARVVLLRSERTLEGELVRRMVDLELARASTSVFALTWTVIHPITPKSPLYGKTRAWLEDGSTEIICSVMGHDDTFSQTVHARHSYQPSEVVFGARLADVFSVNEAGKRVIDYRRFHEVELLPAASETAERASA